MSVVNLRLLFACALLLLISSIKVDVSQNPFTFATTLPWYILPVPSHLLPGRIENFGKIVDCSCPCPCSSSFLSTGQYATYFVSGTYATKYHSDGKLVCKFTLFAFCLMSSFRKEVLHC